ncbi:MAG TPA: alpha/beta fold hydrolase [Chloroflexota bacterium]|nr:alpha/beta fold hydrolase [Chloroflexota bacterium]
MTAPPASTGAQVLEESLRTLRRVMTTRYPVAQTPKELIWSLNKAKLYRYVPVVHPENRHPVPLLLVFALINRSYILDLRPGNSFVEYMVSKGHDVYLLDWGIPGPEDKALTFDDYVLDYLPRAIRKLKTVSGSDEFSLLGWCIGAILTTVYAALRPGDGLRNLILLTAPLDFSDRQCGGLIRWVSDENFDVERVVQSYGIVPGEVIDYGAKALRPVENYISNFLRLWDNLDDPKIVDSWHAMNTWVNDVIPMTGGSFKQLIVDFYRENRLMNGTLTIRGERVDLGHLCAALLNVIAENDHIVPPPESEPTAGVVGSADATTIRVPGGHIGIMAGSGAVKNTWPKIDDWLAVRSDSR